MNLISTKSHCITDIAEESSTFQPTKKEIAESIRTWGGPASMTLLDPTCKHFRCSSISGMIGYRIEKGCAIVYGDPVCDPSDKCNLATSFQEYCQLRKWRVIYIAVSEIFATWAMQHVCSTLLEIGDELILNPQFDPKKGSRGRVLRRKTNHARAENVTIDEYSSLDISLKQAIEKVALTWLQNRKGPQVYLADINSGEYIVGKRIFYAQHQGQVVGVLWLNELTSKKGWLVHLLMITPEAPNGTPELIITTAIEKLRQEGCQYLSFGVTQGNQLGEIIGFNCVSGWLARQLFKIAQKLFSLDGRRNFWQKFQPDSERSFLIWDRKGIGFKQLRGIKRALNISL